MRNNSEKPFLEKYKDLFDQVEPLILEEQEKTVLCSLDDFRNTLSSGDSSENDERCIIQTIDLLINYCPDFTQEDFREEVYKIYNNLNLSPKSDIMKTFLGCKNMME